MNRPKGKMSEELNRISLTIPENLLDRVDEVLEKEDYSSRSEAVRDALRDFLTEHQWRKELKGKQRGVVVMVYEHDVRGLNEKLLDIQHEERDIIKSVQHLHVGRHECIEAIIVNGPGECIRDLADSLKSLDGVKQVKLAVVGK